MSVSKDEMRAAIYKNWACHKNRTRVDFQMFQAVSALIEHGPKVEIETAFFEIYKEGRRKYWFGAEAGWKGGAEVGEKGVLMMNAKHFKAGTIIRVYEP